MAGHFMGPIEGGHPDDPRALSRRNFNRHGIHPSYGSVERDRAQDMHLWHKRAHERGAWRAGHIMGFDDKTSQPSLSKPITQLDFDSTSRQKTRTIFHIPLIA